MWGTIANTGSIIIGSVVGSALKKGIGEKYKNVLMDAMGLAACTLGIRTAVCAMLRSRFHVLFIVSLALGGLVGTKLNISGRFDSAVNKISKGSDLAKGLSTAILLFCIGTLSILGPVQSALYNDNTFLFTNAVMDGFTSAVLSSAFGLGIALAAGVLFCFQGSIYLLAIALGPFLSDDLMTEVSLVGGILILCSGLGLLNIKKIRTMDLLPALLLPPAAIVLFRGLGI